MSKIIEGYPTYSITHEGIITNIKRNKPVRHRMRMNYLAVDLSHCGARKTFYVHRLVAQAFVPRPEGVKTEVDHIDRNKLNCCASNLRWVTHSENMKNMGRNKPSEEHGEQQWKRERNGEVGTHDETRDIRTGDEVRMPHAGGQEHQPHEEAGTDTVFNQTAVSRT